MGSRVRRRSAAAVGVLGAGLALYGAHRAARRALGGVLLTTAVPVEPLPEIDAVGEVIRRIFGRAPTPAPIIPTPGGGQHGQGWPGLLSYLEQFTADQGFRSPVLDWDPIQGAQDGVRWTWEGYAAAGEIQWDAWQTLFGFFSDAFGTGWDLASAFIQGARQYAAELLGLATGAQINALANMVHSLTDQLHRQLLELRSDVSDLLEWAAEIGPLIRDAIDVPRYTFNQVFAHLEALGATIVNGLFSVQVQIDGLTENLGDVVENLPELDPGAVPEIVEHYLTENLFQTTVNSVQLLLPVIVSQVTANLPKNFADAFPDAARQAADNERCCAAATDAINKAKPDLDKLAKLLAGLAGLFAAVTADDLLALISGWLDGSGVDLGAMLGGWLDGDVDPIELVGTAAGGFLGELLP